MQSYDITRAHMLTFFCARLELKYRFLDLISSRPNSMTVPTLDIDLVWHTHQLMAARYGLDCEHYVGRYVDQLVFVFVFREPNQTSYLSELKVRENRLSAAFDETCLAWQASDPSIHIFTSLIAVQVRYQVPYMQCGCTLPNESSWRKCMRLVRQHLRSKAYLPTSLHRDHIPATHPSIHNAILSSHRRMIELPGWMMSDGGRNHATHTNHGVQVHSHSMHAPGYGAQEKGDGMKAQGHAYGMQAPAQEPQLSRKVSGRGSVYPQPKPKPKSPSQEYRVQTPAPLLSRKVSGRGTQPTQPHRSDSTRRKQGGQGPPKVDRKPSGRPADFGYYGRGPVYVY